MQISDATREKLNLVRIPITFDQNENLTTEDLMNGSLSLIRLGDLLHDIFDAINDETKGYVEKEKISC